ncbi:MAG TPA: hypothetical protein VHC21_00820 [Candidatus Saccharimonadales bacterium]|nr:hypothetical protein [Candidatus Saccharimonadales bacterium]
MNPSLPNQPNPVPGQPSAAGAQPQAVEIQAAGLPRAEDSRFIAPIANPTQLPAAAPKPPAPAAAAPAPALPEPTPAPAPPAAPAVVAPPAPTTVQPQTPAAPAPPPPVAPQSAGQPAVVAKTATPPPKQKNPNSTQNSLQIAEVRDGIVIMNDGSYRSVVMVKSINFDLMSPQEQEAVEYSYQGFLNSLYFPIQIFIRSQKVDLQPYIAKLDKIRTEHDNMLLALLMEDYITYIDDLSQHTNIMDKKFYVVIPYYPTVDAQKALTQSKNFLTGIGNLFSRHEDHVVINEPDLENAKTELRNRVQAVLSGLLQAGIQGLPLDTQELIELYYDTYNPDTATRQQLKNFNDLSADVITKGTGAAPQAHLQRELQS